MTLYKAKSFFESAKYACNGILYAFNTQSNMKRILVIALLVIIISAVFTLSFLEWAVIVMCLTISIFAEMVNTTTETIIDAHYCDEYSQIAKNAKDIAAGAVLIVSFGDIIIGLLIFMPKFINIIMNYVQI